MVLLFSKSKRKNKKYKVVIKRRGLRNKTVHFGDKRYQQFKDSTPLKIYKSKDHGDKKRQKNYFARHGKKAKIYTPKYFSHKYLWK